MLTSLKPRGVPLEPGLWVTINMIEQRTQKPCGFYPLRYDTTMENIRR